MKKIAILFVKFYKASIRPLLPNVCRFTPSCSDYAIEALQKYGFLKGGFLSLKRIVRCNPFCKHGHDPVP
ncbi:MAG: membrane protein insertion efficiency factor YidD [Bacteroidetes bacterium]|nr:membrane protein insertion efficiency factor YidD [Bacteroidota bacterium]